MIFVHLPDAGFRLDLLTWWGSPDDDENPEHRTRYDLLIGTDEVTCHTTATIEEFADAVRDAVGRAAMAARYDGPRS